MSKKTFCDRCDKEVVGTNPGRKWTNFDDGEWFINIKVGPKVDKYSANYDICQRCVLEILSKSSAKKEK